MSEKLTVNKIGTVKTIGYNDKKTGEAKSFQKVGIQTNERGAQWLDFTFRGNNPLVIGKQYDMEVKSREYNGKTYFDASFPKPAGGGGFRAPAGLSEDDKAALAQASSEAYAARVAIQSLTQRLEAAGVLKAPGSVVPGTNIPYPTEEVGNPFPDEEPTETNDEPPVEAYDDPAQQ